MTTQAELPEAVAAFVRDTEGSLGANLVGVVLFGSYASGQENADSDIDLAVFIADSEAEQSREQVYHRFASAGLNRDAVSLSVETYGRLKDFLKAGDPFAWTVCHDGRILTERSALLSVLQTECQSGKNIPEPSSLVRYLQGKCSSHYDLAMHAFDQVLSNLQLSVMAGSQAAAAQMHGGKLSKAHLLSLSNWEELKGILIDLGANRREIHTLDKLVAAHKLARLDHPAFPGKEIVEGARSAGNLWRRLFAERRHSDGASA